MDYNCCVSTVFFVVAGILLTYQIYLIVVSLKEKTKLRKDRAKINKICRSLYGEYAKVKGPDWAEKTIESIIKDVVKTVEHGTSRMRRVS